MAYTVQKNYEGRYTSRLLSNRYQIMESWLMDDVYYVWDAKQDNQIRGRGGEIVYFSSIDEATKFIQGKK